MTVTDDSLWVGHARVRLRCRVDTEPLLSAEVVTRLTGAIADVIAIAYVMVSPDVRIRPEPRIGRAIHMPAPRGERFGPIPGVITISGPPVQGIRGARVVPLRLAVSRARRSLEVSSINYRNPLGFDIDPSGLGKAAGGMSGFINNMLNGVAQRRLTHAEADRAEINNAVLDATLDESVDMRFAELESVELDNELKREKLKQAKVQTELDRLHLAREIHKLLADIPGREQWTVGDVNEVVDDVRVIASTKAMAALGMTASLEIEEAEQKSDQDGDQDDL